jgi:lysozyme family protein
MADFNLFLPKLLTFEGGFVDDPADPGGTVNKGVTLQTLLACSQALLGVAPTLDNLRALTDAQAGIIYKARYWDKLRGDEIANQGLAELLVDFYVSAGNVAVSALQQALNELGKALPVNGVFDDATFAALDASPAPDLFSRLREVRVNYYTALATRSPALQPFLQGWLNRANSFVESPS